MAGTNKYLARSNKSRTGAKRLRSVKRVKSTKVDPMGSDHRIVPAIKQALSMLEQAREALLFAQCPAAVAKVRRAIKSTQGALRTAKRRLQTNRVARSDAHPMARKANPLGERDSLSVNESEVIIELGAEGGSITLSGFRTERGWSFSRALTDWTPELIDEERIQHQSAVVDSWKVL